MRYLDAFPIEHEGQNYICLRDPEGYIESDLILTPYAFFLATLLDGKREVMDIQTAFAKQFQGVILQTADIHKIVNHLDSYGALLTDRFSQIKKGVDKHFLTSANRPAYYAGKSYQSSAAGLKRQIDQFFLNEKGPGRLPLPATETKTFTGLIAPHIDFHRGGTTYAHGYLQFAEASKPKTVFIFGVAHATPPVPFVLTKKNFDTPWGTIPTDASVVDRLSGSCRWDAFAYETVHRMEHSIEFQTVMLGYLFGTSVKIVPILCGAFALDRVPENPDTEPHIQSFIKECHTLLAEFGPDASVIVGADLAHVGKRFGDFFEIDDSIISKIRSRDQADLECVEQIDGLKFYQSVMKDRNERRVCGLNCIYSALKAAQGLASSMKIIDYGYAPDPAGGIVSYASCLMI